MWPWTARGCAIADSTAIAVRIVRWRRTEPPDVHVAGGDLELANGERHGSVDAKLVLVVAVREASRLRRQLVEPACGNRVTHVAGSHRQELRQPGSARQPVRPVCPIRRCRTRRRFRSICFCTGVLSTSQAEGAKSAPRPSPARAAGRWVHFLGRARRGDDITQTARALGTRYRANACERRISISTTSPSDDIRRTSL